MDTNAKRRSLAKSLQSPNEVKDQTEAFKQQVDRYGLKDGSASDQFFTRKDNEDVHHRSGLLNLLNLGEVTEGVGNNLPNLMVVPKPAHQGKGEGKEHAVHNILRANGLTTDSAEDKKHPLIKEIEMSQGKSKKYRMNLWERYKKEIVPLEKQAIDDAMTHYYEPTRESQAKARERVAKYKNNNSALKGGRLNNSPAIRRS